MTGQKFQGLGLKTNASKTRFSRSRFPFMSKKYESGWLGYLKRLSFFLGPENRSFFVSKLNCLQDSEKEEVTSFSKRTYFFFLFQKSGFTKYSIHSALLHFSFKARPFLSSMQLQTGIWGCLIRFVKG